jgi:hypothetical protein
MPGKGKKISGVADSPVVSFISVVSIHVFYAFLALKN